MRLFVSFVLIASTIFIGTFMSDASESRAQQQSAPAYVKWGRIAMEKVKERYQTADIIDYLHIGRSVGNKTSTEKFKLWLKEGNREFGVFVDITFDNETEEIVNIEFKETDR